METNHCQLEHRLSYHISKISSMLKDQDYLHLQLGSELQLVRTCIKAMSLPDREEATYWTNHQEELA